MGNKEWKVGDSVMFIPTGEEFIIDGFSCCPGCGDPQLYLKGYNNIGENVCADDMNNRKRGCGYIQPNCRTSTSRSMFVRPDLSSLENYHKEITVRELAIPVELKELKNLEN